MLFLIGISFFILGYIGYKTSKSIISPQVLVTITWGTILILYQFFGSNTYFPLTGRFNICIISWTFSFFIGCYIGEIITKPSIERISPDKYVMNIYYIFAPFFCLISAILTLNMVMNSDNIFLSLRIMNTGIDEEIKQVDFGIFNYLYYLIFILYLIELSTNGLKRKQHVAVLFILNLINCILSMAKTSLLILFFSSLVILKLKNSIRIRTIIIGFIVLISLMFYFQMARTIDGNLEMDFIIDYLFSGIPAFDRYHEKYLNDCGENVLRFLYAIGSSIGVTEQPVSTILDYINVGNVSTNVYTVMYPFYSDFGIWGLWLFGLFYGIIGGWLYVKRKNNNAFLVLYGIFAAQILFQFTGDLLITNTSSTIQYIIYSILPFYIHFNHG